MIQRIKRVAREALGLPPWPLTFVPRPVDLEQQVYSALLHPGDVVYDVGANDGTMARYFAALVRPSGVVCAFEPVPATYAVLCMNLQGDYIARAPILTFPIGLSDSSGPRALSIPGKLTTRASVANPAAWQAVQGNLATAIVEAPFTTLDDARKAYSLSTPTVLKIDVEGAEAAVLRGARGILSECCPLIVAEVYAPWQRACGFTPWDTLSILADHGYKTLFQCPGGLVAHTPTQADPFPPAYRHGDTLVAYQSSHHVERMAALEPLHHGTGKALPVRQLPHPNE